MDSPLSGDEAAPTPELTSSDRATVSKAARRRRKRPSSIQTKRLLIQARNRQRNRIIAAAAICGIAIAALLVFVLRSGDGARPSVTTKIPDARTAVAAVNSLPPPNLLKPVSPEEAAKENAERPFTDRPDAPASRFILKAAEADRERALTCLTQAVYYEAASEGADGGRAVAQVIINRLRHPGYPASICGVVYEGSDRPTGCQFTFTCDGSLLRPHVNSLWTRSQKIAKDALAGHVFAPVGHATHYHADYVLPYWADSLDKSVQIGRHIFYRLRGSVGDSRSFFQRYAGFEPPIPQPRPAIVVPTPPTEAEQKQLVTALIGEDSKGAAKDAEKISAPEHPLLVDATRSTLIADGGAAPVANKRKKAAATCSGGTDSGRLSPLAATDMRTDSASPSC